ncbi:MAG TPA: exodeoxyribonuclease V, partial [Streptomyces sp.]|nr:exodeoxyribonuclease V [Streptomyces sp.]
MTDDKAAELLAAVKAVEKGERSAASFFNEPGPQAAESARPQRPATPAARPASAGAPAGTGPVTVPDELR